MIGDVDFDRYEDSDYIIVVIFHVYVILVSVCLLNVLIAMMGNTFESFNEVSKDIFDLQRIMITISVEGNIDDEDTYATEVGSSSYRLTCGRRLHHDDNLLI